MHLEQGQRITLAIGEKRSPELVGLLWMRDMARRQLQERRGRRTPIGDAIKVVIIKVGTKGWSNGFDRVAESKFGEVDRASHNWQQVSQSSDQGVQGCAEIRKIHSQFF